MKTGFLRAALCLLGLVASLPAATTTSAATDKRFDLGGGKTVVFTLPAGWEIGPVEGAPDLAVLGKSIKLVPKNGANAECDITMMLTPDDRFADHEVLKSVVLTAADQLVGDSLEGRANPREFKTPHAFGYAATFTDKNLVGKAPERGNYKTATTVVLYLPEQIAVSATLLCDDINGPDYAAMVAMLRSLSARSAANSI